MADIATVLLVCPATDLRYARSERSNWANALHLRVVEVPSPVTIESVTRAIESIQPEGLAVLGHGTADGIPLDDGELLDYDVLAPFIRGRVRWMYLGVCDSYTLGQEIASTLGIPVLCTIGPIYDRAAYAMGSGLVSALDNGVSFEDYARANDSPGQTRGFRLVTPPPAAEGDRFHRCLAMVPA